MDEDSKIVPFDNILHIFESVEQGDIDEAVVPIENSTEGSVLVTLDALTYFDLNIVKELELPIKHNLLAQKGSSIDDITVICSHQQALAQCRKYLNKLNKQVHAMSSTATAARYVTELSSAAVIGNEILSQKYNLEIIASNIQDYDQELEDKLTEFLRDYYDNNASDTLSKIYAECLKALRSIANKSGLSEQNKIAALYEITASSMDNRKFFWDLIGSEKM